MEIDMPAPICNSPQSAHSPQNKVRELIIRVQNVLSDYWAALSRNETEEVLAQMEALERRCSGYLQGRIPWCEPPRFTDVEIVIEGAAIIDLWGNHLPFRRRQSILQEGLDVLSLAADIIGDVVQKARRAA
jgi:hypothetical protein